MGNLCYVFVVYFGVIGWEENFRWEYKVVVYDLNILVVV